MRMVLALREELGASAGTVTRVAPQLGYGVESVRKWVAQAEIDAGVRAGLSSAESEELRRLRQENRELRRANEILERATTRARTRGTPRTKPRPKCGQSASLTSGSSASETMWNTTLTRAMPPSTPLRSLATRHCARARDD